MLDAILDPAFNGADVVALFALPVALWFLVRPRKQPEPHDA